MPDPLRNIAIKQEYRALYATFDRWLSSPDGQVCMDHLHNFYNGTIIQYGPDKRLDEFATIAANGSREVLLHMEGMRTKNATVD